MSRVLMLDGFSRREFLRQAACLVPPEPWDFAENRSELPSRQPSAKPVAIWLEEHLAFPNWTAEVVREMPESHIRRWAQLHHLELEREYAIEQREGGTQALGDRVPGIPREQLDGGASESQNRRKLIDR